MLDELAGLARHRHGEILRVVELVPIAFGGKLREPNAERFQSAGSMHHDLPFAVRVQQRAIVYCTEIPA
jgi:hypothetical protein